MYVPKTSGKFIIHLGEFPLPDGVHLHLERHPLPGVLPVGEIRLELRLERLLLPPPPRAPARWDSTSFPKGTPPPRTTLAESFFSTVCPSEVAVNPNSTKSDPAAPRSSTAWYWAKDSWRRLTAASTSP